MRETSFVSFTAIQEHMCPQNIHSNYILIYNSLQNDPNQQINTNMVSYGAVEHVAGNPFANNTITEEAVQPDATDSYMHGNQYDRNY